MFATCQCWVRMAIGGKFLARRHEVVEAMHHLIVHFIIALAQLARATIDQ